MSKAGLIILFGLILTFLPFLGVPLVFKTTLAVVLGIATMGLGFLVREERRWLVRALKGDFQTDAYTENGAQAYEQTTTEA
ncbi:MAG: hypothetical protein ACJKTH_00230 [Patescibacteria group bacterium UBA2163]